MWRCNSEESIVCQEARPPGIAISEGVQSKRRGPMKLAKAALGLIDAPGLICCHMGITVNERRAPGEGHGDEETGRKGASKKSGKGRERREVWM